MVNFAHIKRLGTHHDFVLIRLKFGRVIGGEEPSKVCGAAGAGEDRLGGVGGVGVKIDYFVGTLKRDIGVVRSWLHVYFKY